jgi:hypothetical protein
MAVVYGPRVEPGARDMVRADYNPRAIVAKQANQHFSRKLLELNDLGLKRLRWRSTLGRRGRYHDIIDGNTAARRSSALEMSS